MKQMSLKVSDVYWNEYVKIAGSPSATKQQKEMAFQRYRMHRLPELEGCQPMRVIQ